MSQKTHCVQVVVVTTEIHAVPWTTTAYFTVLKCTVRERADVLRHLQDYHISSIRTAKRLKHSDIYMEYIWNSLSSEIKAINNFHSFTRSVKSSLIDVYE